MNSTSSWLVFTYIFSWLQFRDTLPGLISLFVLCVYNGIVNHNLLFHMRKFLHYSLLCYFLYSIHSWSNNIEQKIFGELGHFYDAGIWLCLLAEFSNFYIHGEKVLNISIPLIGYAMQKINTFIEAVMPFTKDKNK